MECPIRYVEAFAPIAGPVSANAVIILDVRGFEFALAQDKTSKATIGNREIEHSSNLKRDWDLSVRRKVIETFLDYLYVHDKITPLLPPMRPYHMESCAGPK